MERGSPPGVRRGEPWGGIGGGAGGAMADDTTIIEGTVKFRDGKKVSAYPPCALLHTLIA